MSNGLSQETMLNKVVDNYIFEHLSDYPTFNINPLSGIKGSLTKPSIEWKLREFYDDEGNVNWKGSRWGVDNPNSINYKIKEVSDMLYGEDGTSTYSTDWQNAHFAIDSVMRKHGNPFLRSTKEDDHYGISRSYYRIDSRDLGEFSKDTIVMSPRRYFEQWLAEMGHAKQWGNQPQSVRDSLYSEWKRQWDKYGDATVHSEGAYGVEHQPDKKESFINILKEVSQKTPAGSSTFLVSLLNKVFEKVPSVEWEAHEENEQLVLDEIKDVIKWLEKEGIPNE